MLIGEASETDRKICLTPPLTPNSAEAPVTFPNPHFPLESHTMNAFGSH